MSRLRQFQTAKERLTEARQREFPAGRGVRVVHERYNGYGMVVVDDGCPIDQLAVKLENGNTWWYPLDSCSLANRDTCPPWLQRLMRFEARSATVRRMVARDSEIA
jgi:hypothetical protein